MKQLKRLLATASLIGIIIIGVTSTNAGVIVDLANTDQQPCVETKNSDSKVDNGVIVDFTGVIVDFIGVIVDFTGASNTDCGVIVD